MFHWVTEPSAWLGLIALTSLQVVLGVDNIVLVTVLSRGAPKASREKVRKAGVFVAMFSRIALLSIIALLARLTHPFLTVANHGISVQQIVLGVGGLFLVAKATKEMYVDVEQKHKKPTPQKTSSRILLILVQIFFLDVLFSLDQVITAVGMVKQLSIQVLSIIFSVIVMIFFVNLLAHYLEKHPSLRVLALSFLVLIGVGLIGEAMGYEFPKAYIYFAMLYALSVEIINIRRRTKAVVPIAVESEKV